MAGGLREFIDPKFIIDKLDLSVTGLRDSIIGTPTGKTLYDLHVLLDKLEDALDSVGTDKLRVSLVDALPAGTNYIGKVALGDGTNWITAQLIGAATYGFGVGVFDPDGNRMPTMDAVGRPGFMELTDGTNTMPTMDVVARAGFMQITDGTNILPTMDAIARAGFQKITDGTNLQTLIAISATEYGLGVGLVDASGNRLPSMDVVGRAGFIKLTDGTNLMPTMDAGARRGYVQLHDGTNPILPDAIALGDALANPTTTLIGAALLGWDGANWKRSALGAGLSKDLGGATRLGQLVIPSGSPMDITRMPYTVAGVSVTTVESDTSIAAPGGKLLGIVNTGGNDVQIGINASVPGTNPMLVKAHHGKIFPWAGATSIYYKTGTGTSTIDITYFN